MDPRFTDDLSNPFELNSQLNESPAFTSLESRLGETVTPFENNELEVLLTPDTQSALSKIDQCQADLKKIQETQVKTLHNMVKALDAVSSVLPVPTEKNKKRGRDDSIDHDSVAFKTIFAAFSYSNPGKLQEFKEEEDQLNQELLSKEKQDEASIQSRQTALYRKRDAYILSEAVANCSKTIKRQACQLENMLTDLQEKQKEILQELKSEKRQGCSEQKEETPPLFPTSPSFLSGSPSTFFKLSNSPPTDTQKNLTPLSEFTL